MKLRPTATHRRFPERSRTQDRFPEPINSCQTEAMSQRQRPQRSGSLTEATARKAGCESERAGTKPHIHRRTEISHGVCFRLVLEPGAATRGYPVESGVRL